MLTLIRPALFAFVVFLALPLLAFAQEDGIANSSPPMPADPNLARIACFRLIYAGDAKAPPVTLAREVRGQDPTLIDSGLPPGTYSPYVMTRPEKFLLHVLDGKIVTPPDKETLKEKKVADPILAEFPAGGYRTILIHERDGKLTASLLVDSSSTGSASPVMRVLDLSGLSDWTIQLLNRKGQLIKPLWQSGSAPEGIAIPASGVYQILVSRKEASGLRQIATLECRLNAGAAFSVVLLPGAVNQGGAFFTFDGTLGSSYNAESVKAIATGPQP